MTKLSVNINKIATIRNSRGGKLPDVIKAAIDIEGFGAEGITVHPRPDERHIRRADVYELIKVVKTELNIEGNPSDSFIDLVTTVKPAQVTLVPDAHNAITSNAGWDTIKNKVHLTNIVKIFNDHGIRVSIFIDPIKEMAEAAAETGAERVELFTEPYALHYLENKEEAIASYVNTAIMASKCGLGINAGHDLSLENLKYFKQQIPNLLEVSIGHALISDALYLGLEKTIGLYKACLV